MNFTENSGLVKTWVNLVKGGTYTREQIPNLFNLREVVEIGRASCRERVSKSV